MFVCSLAQYDHHLDRNETISSTKIIRLPLYLYIDGSELNRVYKKEGLLVVGLILPGESGVLRFQFVDAGVRGGQLLLQLLHVIKRIIQRVGHPNQYHAVVTERLRPNPQYQFLDGYGRDIVWYVFSIHPTARPPARLVYIYYHGWLFYLDRGILQAS